MAAHALSRKDTMIRNAVIYPLLISMILAACIWTSLALMREPTSYRVLLSSSFAVIVLLLLGYFRWSFGPSWMPVRLMEQDGVLVATNLWRREIRLDRAQIKGVRQRRVNRSPPLIEITYIDTSSSRIERLCFHPNQTVEAALRFLESGQTGVDA
jgi:hypothetical protein